MSLHSSQAKIGTTEYLTQRVGHPAFPESKTTVIHTTEPTVREVRTVTTEVNRNEGVSAGEIPTKTIIYTDPSTQIRGDQVITTTASQVYGGEQLYGSQLYGGSQLSGNPQFYRGYRLHNEPVPVLELKEYGHGNIGFRPIEARFFKHDGYGDMINPYCKVKIGRHRQKGSLSKSGGVDVAWNDLIKLDRKHNEHFAKVKCKDKNRVTLHGNLGFCWVDLNELAEKGVICGWFQLFHSPNDDKVTGELLLQIEDLSRTVAPAVV